MATTRRSAADYTVACICPMGVELAPVEGMLDDIHEDLPLKRGHNAYTLGSMGGHNVVIAVMPEIGNNAAATVAAHLKHNFPAIQFSLLVGIGGGVPGKVDVRLGDVVVSQPTELFGGVIQYDMGKKLEGGGFQRTGSLNKPPAVLSANVRRLDAEQRRMGSKLSQYIADMLLKYPYMDTAYSFPAADQDNLFMSNYVHQIGSSCVMCDRHQIVQRAVRATNEPQIHYGTIGTANVVVKDAKVRDELRDMNILCVEMEAAGLMDDFSCLVIRGICDYADSHKNKRWQPYAAAVAAAYMKALLLIIPVVDVSEPVCVDAEYTSPYRVGFHLGLAPIIPSRLFIGRSTDLETMATLLQPETEPSEQKRLVLGGMGGMGKTQLAIAYAKKYQSYYNSIFWLNATSETELKQSYRLMAQQVIQVKEYESLNDDQVLVHILRWLSDPKNTKWLLIFDNYDEPDQFDLRKYCPNTAHGNIIITTRLPNEMEGEQFSVRPLEDIEESIDILAVRSRRRDVKTDAHARSLAKRMQGYPLALVTAGAYLQRSPWTFKRYLEEYEARWNIIPKQPIQLQDYRDRTFYTTWDISYQRLKNENIDASRLLLLLAYFDNNKIWYELLRAGVTDPPESDEEEEEDDADNDDNDNDDESDDNNDVANDNEDDDDEDDDAVPRWLYDVLESDIDFNEVMRILTDYCFIELQESSDSWSMHNCVCDWALAQAERPSGAHCYWYALSCSARLIKKEDWYTLQYAQHARLVPHSVRLANLKPDQFKEQLTKHRCWETCTVAKLLTKHMQYDSAEKLLLRTLAVGEKLFEDENTLSLLNIFYQLGELYGASARLDESEQMYMRALIGYEKVYGPVHYNTLVCVNNLAFVFERHDRLDEAEQMFLRILADHTKNLGTDDISTLLAINNIGLVYEKQDRFDEAERTMLQAMAGKEKVLGTDHISTLAAYHDLAIIYRRQGRLEEAERLYLRALTGKEEALGPNHEEVFETVTGLAEVYQLQNRLGEAERMALRASSGCETALGPDHVFTLDACHVLANVYQNQDRLDEAERTFSRVLAGRDRILGLNHRSTLQTAFDISVLYHRQGRSIEAEVMLERVMAGNMKRFGSTHENTSKAMKLLDEIRSERASLSYKRAQQGVDDHQVTSEVDQKPAQGQVQPQKKAASQDSKGAKQFQSRIPRRKKQPPDARKV